MKKRRISPDETKERLINAGLHLFGIKGYEATRTRELASLAEVNQAAIPYHFGGKEGLYLAVARTVVERGRQDMQEQVGSIVQVVMAGRLTREIAAKSLIGLLHAFVDRVAMADDIADRSRFMMREYSTPGAGFDIIYNGFLENMHKLLCVLVGKLVDEAPESEGVIIRAHSVFGTAISIVLTKSLLLRRLGWEAYPPERMADIKNTIAEVVVHGLQLDDLENISEAS